MVVQTFNHSTRKGETGGCLSLRLACSTRGSSRKQRNPVLKIKKVCACGEEAILGSKYYVEYTRQFSLEEQNQEVSVNV